MAAPTSDCAPHAGQALRSVTITANQSLGAVPAHGLNLSVTGTISLKMPDGEDHAFYFVAGVIHPIRFTMVNSTGTDAGILAGVMKAVWQI